MFIIYIMEETKINEYGYIYCLSNPLYNGIYKVGMTKNDPLIRQKQLYTTGVPKPFIIEFAKEVHNCHEKEKLLHKILAKYGKRVNLKREFFRISLDEIKLLFDLIDGTYYKNDETIDTISDNNDDINYIKSFFGCC